MDLGDGGEEEEGINIYNNGDVNEEDEDDEEDDEDGLLRYVDDSIGGELRREWEDAYHTDMLNHDEAEAAAWEGEEAVGVGDDDEEEVNDDDEEEEKEESGEEEAGETEDEVLGEERAHLRDELELMAGEEELILPHRRLQSKGKGGGGKSGGGKGGGGGKLNGGKGVGGKGKGGGSGGKGKGKSAGGESASSPTATLRPASAGAGNWTTLYKWQSRLMRMGVLVRLRGEVKWSKTSAQQMADGAGSAKNHSARKHKYKQWLGLPSTVGNVEKAYRLPEAIASKDGPPTCVSVEDAADYDVDEGTSASAGVGWEGKVMRWAVLSRCTKSEFGTVDITASVPRYNSSGTLKLGQLPRDGTLLLLQYTRPRNIDPYAQLKGFKRFTTHVGEDATSRAARAARATKFIVFSRARSASTTFITALNAHPNVSCGYEIFSAHNFAADGLREALGFDTHAEVMGRMGDFMGSFWSLCPSLACGFKVFPGQIRPLSALRQIFHGVPPADRPTLRAIILERENVTAEWLSVRKASSTGNWGTSPQRQQSIASSTRLSERLKQAAIQEQHARFDGGAPNSASSAQGAGAEDGGGGGGGSGVSLAQFTREHNAWYKQVGKVARDPGEGAGAIPALRVTTESIIAGGATFEETMRRTYEFLSLPQLTGPLALPARVSAPDKKAVGKRVSKSKVYKQRKEAELKRRAAMGSVGKGKGKGSAT